MTQHKWYKEIQAWSEGAEIEYTWGEGVTWCRVPNISAFDEITLKFRIKPQPKEPQYLYVWQELNYGKAYITANVSASNVPAGYAYLGKIEVQDD